MLADDAADNGSQDAGDDEDRGHHGHVLSVLCHRYHGWRDDHDHGVEARSPDPLEDAEEDARSSHILAV